MALRMADDLSAAGWITYSKLPWNDLVGMGPSGFEAYARLRFLPDPDYPGQSENTVEVGPDHRLDHDVLQAALEVLREHTGTPDDVYYCLWEGWGWPARGPSEATVHVPGLVHVGDGELLVPPEVGGSDEGPAQPGVEPAFWGPHGLPMRVYPRSYHLLRGTLDDFAGWRIDDPTPPGPGNRLPDPAFVWPADHAWCVAFDVDAHYAGIGGASGAVAHLVRHRDLDVVRADPDAEQPFYR